MIDRRLFLKLTGLVAAATGAWGALPVAAQGGADAEPAPASGPPLRAPGTYQLSGRVRFQEPLVEISGISNAQQISWSGGAASPVAGFTSFERFDQPWTLPEIRVRGGQLEALSVVPVELW